MHKQLNIKMDKNRLEAYKMGAKFLDIPMRSMVFYAVDEYLNKHLSDWQKSKIFEATFWTIQKK